MAWKTRKTGIAARTFASAASPRRSYRRTCGPTWWIFSFSCAQTSSQETWKSTERIELWVRAPRIPIAGGTRSCDCTAILPKIS
ncbi:hypothetical protein FKM82_028191 [Ascaphus truei]